VYPFTERFVGPTEQHNRERVVGTDTQMKLRILLFPVWVRWLLVVGIAGFIFYVSVITVPPETAVDGAKPTDWIPLDKWRHFLAYAAFGFTLAYATTDWDLDERKLVALVVGTTIVYGVGIEFAQSLVPDRYFSMGDAYANAFGGVLVVPWYLVSPYLDFVPLGTLLERYRDSLLNRETN